MNTHRGFNTSATPAVPHSHFLSDKARLGEASSCSSSSFLGCRQLGLGWAFCDQAFHQIGCSFYYEYVVDVFEDAFPIEVKQ